LEVPEILLGLHQAIEDRRSVKMTYFTASRRRHTQRVVDPYHLLNARGEWYLMRAALIDVIKNDEDQILIIDLGPLQAGTFAALPGGILNS
jgi:hypothetical protein